MANATDDTGAKFLDDARGSAFECAACLDEMVELLMAARLVSLHAEGHGPQAEGRHRAAAMPQRAIVHAST